MENMNRSKTKYISIIVFIIVIVVASFFLFKGGNKDGGKDNQNVSVSTTDLKVKKGSTITFDISSKNAVGRVDIVSNNADIATVDKDKTWLESISDDEIDTKTISITGQKEGSTQIVVSLSDIVTFDTEKELTGTMEINVTVE